MSRLLAVQKKKNGDTTISSILHGTFISNGPDVNNIVTIKLVSVVHPNGDIDTIVDDLSIEGPG